MVRTGMALRLRSRERRAAVPLRHVEFETEVLGERLEGEGRLSVPHGVVRDRRLMLGERPAIEFPGG